MHDCIFIILVIYNVTIYYTIYYMSIVTTREINTHPARKQLVSVLFSKKNRTDTNYHKEKQN